MIKATDRFLKASGSATLPAMPSSPYVRLRSDWRDLLQHAMTEKRFSARALALAAELNPSAVSEWLNPNKHKEPQFASLARVAGALGLNLETFVEGAETSSLERNKTAPSLTNEKVLAPVLAGRATVLGAVAAGLWQEPSVLDLDEDEAVPTIPKPEFHRAKQYAWRVCGNSLNRIAKHGSYVIGVSLYELSRQPRDNDLVICERWRADVVEYTVKRFRVDGDRVRLDPESDDTRFQEPVWASDGDNHGVDEVKATHLVIGAYTPLA